MTGFLSHFTTAHKKSSTGEEVWQARRTKLTMSGVTGWRKEMAGQGNWGLSVIVVVVVVAVAVVVIN